MGIGTEANANKWNDANKMSFQLLLDQEGKLYRMLGLRRVIVWTIPLIVDLAEKKIAGTLRINHYEGDDLHLMAGDYVVDSSGKFVFAHNECHASDRPSVESILTAIDKATS